MRSCGKGVLARIKKLYNISASAKKGIFIMNTTIKNNRLSVSISSKGAELMSILLDGREYLWQGDENVWSDRSPILFPICGRLKDARYSYKGKTYDMGIHGFLWQSELEITEKREDFIRYTLRDNEETRSIYPFSFEASVTYSLSENSLDISFSLLNTGDETMFFSHGYHPGFILPLCEEDSFSDCYVEFKEKCEPKLVEMSNTTYLFTDRYPDFPLEDGKVLRLSHELFDKQSVFLKDTSRELTLKGKNTDRSVSVSFPECEILGFWQAAECNAKYLCVEPWNGLPSRDGQDEELSTKRAGRSLEAGKRYTNTIRITLK